MKFNVKKRKAHYKDYSFHKTRKLGTILIPDFMLASEILNQNEEDCTAFSSVGARMTEVPQSNFDPMQFWQDELSFAGVQTSMGFDIEVPAAVGVEKGFCPTGNPTLRQNNTSAYFWIHPTNGMDWFDAVLSAVYFSQYPAIGGLNWFSEWMQTPYITSMGKNLLGGHAIRIAGKKTVNGVAYAGLPNTWGQEVGENGIFWMSRDVFNQSFSPYGVFIWSDSKDLTIKTLGLISALWVNIKTLLKIS